MKNFTTMLTMGLAAISISLFAQNNRAAIQPPQANNENPGLISAIYAFPVNLSAGAQIAKSNNARQPQHSGMQKPTIHAPHKIASYIPIYDSIYEWNWDSLSANWYAQAYARGIHLTYDANNNLTGYIVQAFNGSNWVDSEEYVLTYTTHHEVTNEVTKEWVGSAWVNVDSDAYTYDANKDRTGEFYYTWNNPGWTGTYEYSYTYNGNNNETSYTEKDWISSAWTNTDSSAYAYDGNNNETKEVDYQWNTSSWTPTSEYLYSYNGNNEELTYVSNSWSGSAWQNGDSATYGYTGNNNTVEVYYYWNTTAWVKYDSDAYSYNANNKLISKLYFNFNSPNWDSTGEYLYTYDLNNNELLWLYKSWSHGTGWFNQDSDVYTYNADNSETREKDFNGNSNGTAWLNYEESDYGYTANDVEQSFAYKYYNSTGTKITGGDSGYYYQTDVLGINNLSVQNGNLLVYPNPSSGQFTIQLTVGSGQLAAVEVYNVLGEQILIETLRFTQGDNMLDMSNQPDGIYLYRVITQQGNLVGEGKLIIQK